MSDVQKYYYLKMKDNFYDEEKIKIIEGMENGYMYSNILIKMYLRSLKSGGSLAISDRIPYKPDVLAKVLNHNVDVVKQAINIFVELELVEIMDDGVIYMLDIQNYIGKSSTEGDRKRLYRNKIEEKRKLLTDKRPDKCPKAIEDKPKKKKGKGFIPPTPEEVQFYLNERRVKGFTGERFCNWYESKGWMIGKNKMKDWRAAVRTWEQNQREYGKKSKVPKTEDLAGLREEWKKRAEALDDRDKKP